MDNLIEVWKPVVGYEGLYEVSNLGSVKSLHLRKGGKPYILHQFKARDGYIRVYLSRNAETKGCMVHRLVAQAFIPNPNNLPQVNHKDENKANNSVSNLEWCDCKYNSNYGNRTEKIALKHRGVLNTKKSKPVLQYTIDNELIKEWLSLAEVERCTGINAGNIGNCCNGRKKTAGGYKWKFKGEC